MKTKYKENKKQLLKLARETLEAHFKTSKPKISKEIIKKYSEKQACFVTLTENSQLSGCIGSLYPKQELYKDIIENTLNAAFCDPRFPELTKEELSKVKVEISILTLPKKLNYKDEKDLLKKISNKTGIIIKKGYYQATYLPQVWEMINNKEQFLSSLCIKAGLNPDSWKENCEVYTYEVEKLEED